MARGVAGPAQPAAIDRALPDSTRRTLITASTMLAAVLVTLEATIANVALPHIQSTTSASPEQIVWVATSYVIASAIATPLSGWLATRYGRKMVMIVSVAGFTLASIACGFATDLHSLVAFRIVQGAAGAGMVPLSQATLLDIYPREKHGLAMALYGMASMAGGVIGPALGGWLTEMMTWRAVFLINVPFGVLACIGMYLFIPKAESRPGTRFDLFGFVALSIFLASLQLMIDRGQQLDWFDSWEICIEATFMASFGYVFAIHMFTSREPFIKPALLMDRNFAIGSFLSLALGLLVFGALPLIGIMMQQLLLYPVLLAGLVMAPRGLATMASMMVAGRLMGKIDTRILLLAGLISMAMGFRMMSGLSLASHHNEIILAGILMALGSGLIFVPLSTIVFATLDPALRDEGAALFSLVRNMGTSIGISAMQIMTIRNGAVVHARLAEGVRPDNPLLELHAPGFDFGQPAAVAGMHHEVGRQAMMVAYIDAYWMLFVLSLAMMPVVLLFRPPRRPAPAASRPALE